MGLLDKLYNIGGDPNKPEEYLKQQGLLGLSTGLLGSSGWTDRPTSLGQAFGAGLQGMQQMRGQAQKSLIASKKEARLQQYQDMLNKLYGSITGGTPPINGVPAPEGAPPAPGLPLGTSFKIGPRGPEISMDPAKAQAADLERQRAIDEGIIPAAPTPQPAAPMTPRQAQIPLPAGGSVLAPRQRREVAKKAEETRISRESKAGEKRDAATIEAENLLKDMQANMPRIEQVTRELSELGGRATYTTFGKALDVGRKELGMSPRESAVARKAYMSKVDNEILPLLKQTFGAAFTKAEGDSLRATLGDPDATPEAKNAVLKAFIESKKGQIESLQRRTGQSVPTASQGGEKTIVKTGTANGRKVIQYSDGTIEYAD